MELSFAALNRYGSYFVEIKIELLCFLKLLFYWALEVRQTDISKILKIETNTISKYFQTIRALCFLCLNVPFKLEICNKK